MYPYIHYVLYVPLWVAMYQMSDMSVRPGRYLIFTYIGCLGLWGGVGYGQQHINKGDTMNELHTLTETESLTEARMWLWDAGVMGKGRAMALTDDEAVYAVQRTYDGGWDAFLSDCCVYVQL